MPCRDRPGRSSDALPASCRRRRWATSHRWCPNDQSSRFAASFELDERPPAPEARRELVPPVQAVLAEAPAQPDLAPADEGREVDEARRDVAEHDAAVVEPGDVRLHLIDQSTHPELDATDLGVRVADGSAGPVRLARCGLDRGPALDQLVAQADELVALIGETTGAIRQLRQELGCLIDPVETRHRRIVPTQVHQPISASEATTCLGYDAAMELARRMARIGTETAFEAAARARALEAEGRSIVHLEIGEPDFDTPANIRAAAQRALDAGWTHYGPFLGLPALREAIAADASARKGFRATADNVVVVPGAKPIMFYAMLALVDEGDEVVYPDPGFPIYESMARYVGGVAKPYAITQANDFRVDLDELAALVTPRTRLLILNSPANPTGGVLTRDDFAHIAELVLAHPDLTVLTDEIYGRILYDDAEFVSLASFDGLADRTIVLDGFSKTYAMTGWRLGYAIAPPPIVDAFGQLIINSVSCTSMFSQVAAVEALTGPQDDVGRMVDEFHARRDLIVDGLNRIDGIVCRVPHGAFYVFPDISGTGIEGPEMADRLLREAGVCVLSGTSFGEVGRSHIRISYANSRETLHEALGRIERFVAAIAVTSPAGAATA